MFQKQPTQSARALNEWRELNMGKRERIDEDLGQLLNNSHSHYAQEYYAQTNFWHEDNILYKAYTESELYSKEKIKLLFFQVSKFKNSC